MFNMINTVWSVAEDLTRNPKHARPCLDRCVAFGQEIQIKPQPPWGIPSVLNTSNLETSDIRTLCVMYDLIASSVNYMYWYGDSTIRPGNANATKMYSLLDEAFHPPYLFSIRTFKSLLIQNRFPASETRAKHLDELRLSECENFCRQLSKSASAGEKELLSKFLPRLITGFPGFAGDVFLKRAFLFFMMLHRRHGWFSDDIHLLPIPADYQVPKMLRHFGCIEYSGKLAAMIDDSELIPSGSLMECEIRASSLVACREIAKSAGCTMNDVDNFLWLNRKSCNDKFHLTVTTDY